MMTAELTKKVIILLGPPGSGKGTQAAQLAKHYQLFHIDTGAALRTEIKLNSDVGQLAKGYMDKGQLVPSDVVISVIEAAMTRIEPNQSGYLLDGFPRNLTQAEGLDKVLAHLHLNITRVFYLEMDHQLLVDRLAYRQSCPQCGEKYNSKLNPTQVADTCDACGHVGLEVRKDDAPEVIGERLIAYNNETAPLVNYYQERNLCDTVNGQQAIDTIFKQLTTAIDKIAQPVG